MEFRVAIIVVACLSCVVPSVRPVPVVKVAVVGGALGAVKGAIKGAAAASAGALLFKKITNALKGALVAKGAFLKSKELVCDPPEVNSHRSNTAFDAGDVALKTAAHGVTFGAGAALGAAVVAHNPHAEYEETYIEQPHVPQIDHGYYYDHPHSVETPLEPIYHQQAQVPSYHEPTYHEYLPLQHYHHESYSEPHYSFVLPVLRKYYQNCRGDDSLEKFTVVELKAKDSRYKSAYMHDKGIIAINFIQCTSQVAEPQPEDMSRLTIFFILAVTYEVFGDAKGAKDSSAAASGLYSSTLGGGLSGLGSSLAPAGIVTGSAGSGLGGIGNGLGGGAALNNAAAVADRVANAARVQAIAYANTRAVEASRIANAARAQSAAVATSAAQAQAVADAVARNAQDGLLLSGGGNTAVVGVAPASAGVVISSSGLGGLGGLGGYGGSWGLGGGYGGGYGGYGKH
ncbi:hypothetical protein RR48_06887 [Papilio machaon]|uniref:Uncharacterized protein n=1 Tax=Papilio machaon TaxID=76193 RepID=A0A194RA46_PAPMA|nr:hypothetical protein RR48_06887 [Papilio machaon]